MIFNEIYSAYYNTVAKIITRILETGVSREDVDSIVSDTAFGESTLTVMPSIVNEKWQIIKKDLTTPLKNTPTMPLSTVQKQWLKAVLLDPRIRLFDIEVDGLEDVEPLFTADDYKVYDKHGDGDPYEDERYISIFRTILSAINSGQNIRFEMQSRNGRTVYARVKPEYIEYSGKDDKFRVITRGGRFVKTVNIARIIKCSIYNGETETDDTITKKASEWITLKIKDERNAMERCMLHFAHFEKRAEKADDHYLLHICFSPDDEAELVIRVLSFGPMVEVVESERFKKLIIEKLKNQKSCELF